MLPKSCLPAPWNLSAEKKETFVFSFFSSQALEYSQSRYSLAAALGFSSPL